MIVFLLVKPDNKKISVSVEQTCTISDLKKKIQSIDDNNRFHGNLMFTYNQNRLYDEKTIKDYSIEENSTIYFYYSEYRPIYLNIQSFSDKTYYHYFDLTNTFKDVKKYLEKIYNISKDQILVQCDEILDENLKLNQVKSEHLSHPIFICPPTSDNQKQRPIIIKYIKGGYQLVQFNFSEKASDLKKLIQKKFKNNDQPNLYFKETLLEDDKSLKDYHLPEYPLLLVSPRTGGKMVDISFKDYSGKEILMKIESKETIENIKLLMNYIDQHQSIKQNLMINDNCINDDQKTLESLSISNGSKINIKH